MKNIRYVFLMLFVLAPTLAVGQAEPDSVVVEIAGTQYPSLAASFGPQFVLGENIGPLPLVPVVSQATGEFPDAPPAEGCNPLTAESAAEVAGNIAFVERGVCPFVAKVQNAAAAGAVAVVVFNDEREGPDSETITIMGGDCTAEQGCDIPATFVSRASGLAIGTEIKFGEEATIIPIRITAPPPPASVGTHNTGVVTFDVFDYGFLGGDVSFAGNGFQFNGVNGLFVSSVLVGIDGNVVSNPYDGASEWTDVQDVETLAAPFPAPFDDFDAGFIAVFENTDIGIRVTERSYSRADDPFVFVDLEVQNISGSDIAEAFIGLFADWDAGTTSTDDAGVVDLDLNFVGVFDPVEANPWFGVAAIGDPGSLSGFSVDATTADDAQLFEALTTQIDGGGDPAERAAVAGVGPFAIAAGTAVVVRFAYVGGADQADLAANVAAAQELGAVAVEETTPEGTFVLESAYPNPVASRATIGFELPTAQDVRLTVYDVLGREVATLVDGVRQAGAQSVELDVASLPSGVYVYRLSAGATQLTQTLTVVR
ncbi:MAG: PA domain-containing protein [Rhodothermales bacterium]